jgi:hypothetical protein
MSVSWQSIPFDKHEIDLINQICEITDQKPKVFIKKAALAFAAHIIADAEKRHAEHTRSLSGEVPDGPGAAASVTRGGEHVE